MAIELDYASPFTRRASKPWVGFVAPAIAACSAIIIVFWCTRLAAAAQMALIIPTLCGTGRHDAEERLYYTMPFSLIVPVVGWCCAPSSGIGDLVSRCAIWTSAIGWLMSVLFVACR
ncbi:MAG TPA: hypothetical protein VH475_10360 [Tepidisphaeraceae bacterium]|jgi:hypothetical protein